MFTLTRRAAAAAGALVISGAAVVMVGPAQAGSGSATYVDSLPAKSITYSPGGTMRPHMAGLDTNGDKVADVWAYCIEPNVNTPRSVSGGSQTLTGYSLLGRQSVVDEGKLRWVLQNGFPSNTPDQALKQIGMTSGGLTQNELKITLSAATQAAVYKYSHGYSVSSTYRYDTRTTTIGRHNSKLFSAYYSFLVTKAVWIGGWELKVWDSKPGEPGTQGVVEVPKEPQEPTPTPTPTKTPGPTPTSDPTKTTAPTPTPTKTSSCPWWRWGCK